MGGGEVYCFEVNSQIAKQIRMNDFKHLCFSQRGGCPLRTRGVIVSLGRWHDRGHTRIHLISKAVFFNNSGRAGLLLSVGGLLFPGWASCWHALHRYSMMQKVRSFEDLISAGV